MVDKNESKRIALFIVVVIIVAAFAIYFILKGLLILHENNVIGNNVNQTEMVDVKNLELMTVYRYGYLKGAKNAKTSNDYHEFDMQWKRDSLHFKTILELSQPFE